MTPRRENPKFNAHEFEEMKRRIEELESDRLEKDEEIKKLMIANTASATMIVCLVRKVDELLSLKIRSKVAS